MKYRVLMNGRNFLIEMEGKERKYGFFQTFFVDAESPERAERLVVQKIKDNPDLARVVRNVRSDPPTIHLEELEQVGVFPADNKVEAGRAWYSEEGDA